MLNVPSYQLVQGWLRCMKQQRADCSLQCCSEVGTFPTDNLPAGRFSPHISPQTNPSGHLQPPNLRSGQLNLLLHYIRLI